MRIKKRVIMLVLLLIVITLSLSVLAKSHNREHGDSKDQNSDNQNSNDNDGDYREQSSADSDGGTVINGATFNGVGKTPAGTSKGKGIRKKSKPSGIICSELSKECGGCKAGIMTRSKNSDGSCGKWSKCFLPNGVKIDNGYCLRSRDCNREAQTRSVSCVDSNTRLVEIENLISDCCGRNCIIDSHNVWITLNHDSCQLAEYCLNGNCVPCLSTEVCDNNVDDNCDSFVDMDDLDCSSLASQLLGGGTRSRVTPGSNNQGLANLFNSYNDDNDKDSNVNTNDFEGHGFDDDTKNKKRDNGKGQNGDKNRDNSKDNNRGAERIEDKRGSTGDDVTHGSDDLANDMDDGDAGRDQGSNLRGESITDISNAAKRNRNNRGGQLDDSDSVANDRLSLFTDLSGYLQNADSGMASGSSNIGSEQSGGRVLSRVGDILDNTDRDQTDSQISDINQDTQDVPGKQHTSTAGSDSGEHADIINSSTLRYTVQSITDVGDNLDSSEELPGDLVSNSLSIDQFDGSSSKRTSDGDDSQTTKHNLFREFVKSDPEISHSKEQINTVVSRIQKVDDSRRRKRIDIRDKHEVTKKALILKKSKKSFKTQGQVNTKISIRIIPKNPLFNFTLYEDIPKSVASSVSELKFSNRNYTVLEDDPLVAWHFTIVDEPIDISYVVEKEIKEVPISVPVAAEVGEKVLVQPPSFLSITLPLLLIPILVVTFVFFSRFSLHSDLE